MLFYQQVNQFLYIYVVDVLYNKKSFFYGHLSSHPFLSVVECESWTFFPTIQPFSFYKMFYEASIVTELLKIGKNINAELSFIILRSLMMYFNAKHLHTGICIISWPL